MEKEMKEYWGPRCPDYFAGCACCEAWKLFDQLKRMPTDKEVGDAVDAAPTEAPK